MGAGGEEGGVEAEDFVAALHRKGGFAVASHGTCNEGAKSSAAQTVSGENGREDATLAGKLGR